MRRIIGLFVPLLIIEVLIFLEVASSIGSLNTVILVIFTTALAPLILRDVSGKIIKRVKESLSQKINPAPHLASGFFRLIAGMLLFLPGFMSDFIGLLFWLISFRPDILASLNIASGFGSPEKNRQSDDTTNPEENGQVIEGEFRNLKDEKKKQYD